MKWRNKGHEFDEIGKNFVNKMIYIYGAGGVGNALFEKLYFCKDKVAGFIDNFKAGTIINEKKVIDIEHFIELDCKNNIVIVAGSDFNMSLFSQSLRRAGYRDGINLFNVYDFEYFYMSLFSIYGCDKLYVPVVGHLVTTKCNLDCKGCLNFTHVNPIKRHYEYEVLKEDIDKFFSAVDYVGMFSVCGGEPFLYPLLSDVIAYIGRNYRERICELRVTTNGTIVPSECLCKTLEKNRVTVYVDDYRKNVSLARKKYSSVINALKNNDISVVENDAEYWFMFEKIENCQTQWTGEEQLINHFNACSMPFVSLHNQKIYQCNYADYAYESQCYLADVRDYFDISEWNVGQKMEFQEYVLGYSERGYCEYCKNCRGYININTKKIEVAEQYL